MSVPNKTPAGANGKGVLNRQREQKKSVCLAKARPIECWGYKKKAVNGSERFFYTPRANEGEAPPPCR